MKNWDYYLDYGASIGFAIWSTFKVESDKEIAIYMMLFAILCAIFAIIDKKGDR